ncbi:MAG: hypothetical protein RI955_883 [Bacteroidota bacterium]|jgi:hypothetical protein
MLKFIVSLSVVCGVVFTSMAQDITLKANKDNALPKLNTYKKMDYFHLEASWLTLLDKPDSVKVKPLSHSFSAYLSYPMQIGKSHFNFTPGIGISVDNIYTNSKVKLDTASKLYLSPIASGISYKMNKQTYGYLTAPITLNYFSNNDKNGKAWKASLGLRFNMLVNSHTKYKGNDDKGIAEKIKTFNIPYTNKYRVDAAFTIGYDWIYLTANYSLTNYVATGKGLQYHPFNIGIGVVGF